MAGSTSELLMEAIVRKALSDVEHSLKRSTRNLVDMALNFSSGRRASFFRMIQDALRNEGSAYYKLAQEIVINVDHDRLVRFGVNVAFGGRRTDGGAPRAMRLEIDGDRFDGKQTIYDRLTRRGKEKGVCLWVVCVRGVLDRVLEWMAAHSDCAFVLYCPAREADGAVQEQASALKHVMLGVGMDGQAGAVCAQLRARGMLYAVCAEYSERNVEEIMGDRLARNTADMAAPVTVLLPAASAGADVRSAVREYAASRRKAPRFPTVVVEAAEIETLDAAEADD